MSRSGCSPALGASFLGMAQHMARTTKQDQIVRRMVCCRSVDVVQVHGSWPVVPITAVHADLVAFNNGRAQFAVEKALRVAGARNAASPLRIALRTPTFFHALKLLWRRRDAASGGCCGRNRMRNGGSTHESVAHRGSMLRRALVARPTYGCRTFACARTVLVTPASDTTRERLNLRSANLTFNDNHG